MAEFEIVFKNRKGINLFVDDLVSRSDQVKKRKSEFVDVLSAIVFKDVMQHFDKEKGPTSRWKMWSKIYAERMAKLGKRGNKILQDSGRMRNSFTPKKVRKVANGLVWFNPAKTKDGFPYAASHDQGGNKLPQREFMYLSDGALGKIESETLRFMESK